MKNMLPVLMLLFVALCGCKPKNSTSETLAADKPSTGSTYAEISIAQGGKWEGREYKNRTSFLNVDQLSVPTQHTDHSYYLRYEGPGWESDKVGYRLYLDWRNAIDIFGKKTDDMILSQVGQDNFDSYHEMEDWGVDILKVGKALGLGSYGRMVGDSVYHFQNLDSTNISVINKADYSAIDINYYGWQAEHIKTDLNAKFTIKPDSRLTKVSLAGLTPAEGLVTGIVKHANTEVLQGSKSSQWNYLATYGSQTLFSDDLGMVIFYKNKDAEGVTEGNYDHLIQFNKEATDLEYYFAAAWVGEKDGIKNRDEFYHYIESTAKQLGK